MVLTGENFCAASRSAFDIYAKEWAESTVTRNLISRRLEVNLSSLTFSLFPACLAYFHITDGSGDDATFVEAIIPTFVKTILI